MRLRFFLLGLLVPLAALPLPLRAAETASAPMQVLHPILHTEQEGAELCLEFDRAPDVAGVAARVAAALRLESDGKTVEISGKNINLGGDQLCLSPLEHRREYHLDLDALRGANDEELSHPYSLSFYVPARRPALAFVNRESRDGLAIWRENPVLHSINSTNVTLELYRITDPARMAEAWNQRLQTTLAPSESLYFARNNGTLVWKGALTLEPAADKNIESKIDFAAADFPPGLYLIAASAADAPSAKDILGRDEPDRKTALTPAAAWLLRSSLSLQALREGKVLTAFAAAADASAVLKDVHFLVLDRNQQILAEARSDAGGRAQIAPKPDSGEAQVLVGLGDKGDVAFLDLARDTIQNPSLPPMMASLAADQGLYAPTETINVALAARDLHKHPVSLTGSVLQILRPDRSLYDSRPVALDPNGAARLSFPAPAPGGLWHLVWRPGDGKPLAEMSVRISGNPAAPELGFTADRPALAADGGVNLTIRSQTNAGSPAPYIAGHVELAWNKPEHPFVAWKDYIFDDGKTVDATVRRVGFFLTDAKGIARLHLVLSAPSMAPSLRQAQLRVVGDPSLDTLDPEPLVLPVRPADIVLGIKPRAGKGHFPENSLAHFDVVALDGDGQRRAVDGLTYQIYEQGRSFEWFQSGGHWDYRPQQQRRRIGGGRLSFTSANQASIEWPVTSGAYRLEINNGEGVLLAREDFNAGWGFTDRQKDDVAALDLKASSPVLQSGREEKIDFALARPGLVTAIVADDHVRSFVHGVFPAGANSLTFTPDADWGSQAIVRVQVRYGAEAGGSPYAAGQILLSSGGEVQQPPRAAVKPVQAAKAGFSDSANPVLREVSRQQIAPQQGWIPVAGKPHAAAGAESVFLAAVPFFDLPSLLPVALNRHPFVTRDIARQLAVLRLWHDAILAANLMPEADFRARRNDLLLRLLARQNADGGFTPIPGGGSSDIVSTAAAVETLNLLGDATARPAIEQAGAWLRRRLENTWFGEEERPERAVAYAALAEIGKLDLASLHYFSDTSADKSLLPLAAAEMAYAFATTGDKAAANFWLDKSKNASGAETASPTADLLPVLLANAFFASDSAQASLEKASKRALAATDDFEEVDDFLLAVWRFEDRAGSWRVALGKEEKTVRGILVLPVLDKAPVALRNPASDRTLYLEVAVAAKAAAVKSAGQRRIFRLDGGEVSGRLTRGATYLVMLEGAWPGGGEALVLHENPQPALLPAGCAIEAPSADVFLGWLAYKAPMAARSCERSADGLDLLLTRGEKSPGSFWRVAYLAKATGDARAPRPVTARTLAAPSPDDKGGRN